jgi:hypothetical protein
VVIVFAVWWRNVAAGCGIPRAGLPSAAKAVNRQRSRTSALESIADLRRKLARGGGGNLDTAAGALTSPANFLKGHRWRAGAGYQPGEARHGMLARSISGPSRLLADRLTEDRASLRGAEDRAPKESILPSSVICAISV